MAREKRTTSLPMPDDVAEPLRLARKTVVAMACDGRDPHITCKLCVTITPARTTRPDG